MTTRKTFLNNADQCVVEFFKSLKATHPGLHVDVNFRIVMINRERKSRVAILSGGGSGHEPFAAGYVGERMLTASVSGTVFCSPPSTNILSAINNLARLNCGGILVLVLNYTGDVLNFGLAIEIARARGIQIESIVIGDDCSTTNKETHSIAGKRGLCGCVFVFKIVGALSSCGRVLQEIVLEAQAITCRLATTGFCLNPCSIPGSGPMFSLNEETIELGVGIHGEAGIATIKICSTQEIVSICLSKIMNELVISPGGSVCVLVNNLGTASQMELHAIVIEVRRQLIEYQLQVARMYVGSFQTALDMNGIQISVLNVTGRDEWLMYLDFDTEATAWPGTRLSHELAKYPDLPISFEPELKEYEIGGGLELNEKGSMIFRKCIKGVCEALISNETKLNQLDSGCGDGDCGSTFRHFSEGILKRLNELPTKRVSSCLLMLSDIAESRMGGTSGALYSLMLLGAARNCNDWASAWSCALQMVRKYSAARVGHRTMLDALVPAFNAFSTHLKELGEDSWLLALQVAVEKAVEGCDNTLDMVAKAGRASYVAISKLVDVDAGAYAVVVWLKAIYEELK